MTPAWPPGAEWAEGERLSLHSDGRLFLRSPGGPSVPLGRVDGFPGPEIPAGLEAEFDALLGAWEDGLDVPDPDVEGPEPTASDIDRWRLEDYRAGLS